MKARCVVHVPVDKVEVREVEVREPGAGEILTESIYSTISPGTELRVLRTRTLGEAFVPGYTNVGRVIKAGAGVKLAEGTVVCTGGSRDAGGVALNWGAHISHVVTGAEGATVLPAGVDPRDACLMRLAAISFRGLHYSKPLPGEKVAVIGLGVIGQLSARLHAIAGCQVVAVDRSEKRVAAANLAGHGVTAVGIKGTLKETFQEYFPKGADVVVDATGVPGVLLEGAAVAAEHPWNGTDAREPRYIIQGAFEKDVTIPFRTAFLKSLQFYIPRDSVPLDRVAVVSLLEQKKLVVRDLLSEVRAPERAAETYAALRDPDSGLLTVAFGWGGQVASSK